MWNRIHYNTWHDKRHVRSFWYGPWTSKVWKSLRPYETTMDTSRLLDLGIRHHIQRSWYQSRPWETMAPQINTDTMPSSIPENWRCRVFENPPKVSFYNFTSEKLFCSRKKCLNFCDKICTKSKSTAVPFFPWKLKWDIFEDFQTLWRNAWLICHVYFTLENIFSN